jgi:hypothetical protein
LLRAADLIGQLATLSISRKLNALSYEFGQIGCNARLGYPSPPMWPTSIRASSGARWNPSSGMRS